MKEIRMGIKKATYETTKRYEGYAIVDGVRKELTPELIAELSKGMAAAKAAGQKVDYTRFWLNENGNPLQSV